MDFDLESATDPEMKQYIPQLRQQVESVLKQVEDADLEAVFLDERRHAFQEKRRTLADRGKDGIPCA